MFAPNNVNTKYGQYILYRDSRQKRQKNGQDRWTYLKLYAPQSYFLQLQGQISNTPKY